MSRFDAMLDAAPKRARPTVVTSIAATGVLLDRKLSER